MPLFTAAELTRQLQYGPDDAISEEDAAQAEWIVDGWLSDATGLDEWPSPLPKNIRAWAIELGGIAHENPTSMSDDQAGESRSAWMDRRSQILAAARAWAEREGHYGQKTAKSRGCFPPARPWPDPARSRW